MLKFENALRFIFFKLKGWSVENNFRALII